LITKGIAATLPQYSPPCLPIWGIMSAYVSMIGRKVISTSSTINLSSHISRKYYSIVCITFLSVQMYYHVKGFVNDLQDGFWIGFIDTLFAQLGTTGNTELRPFSHFTVLRYTRTRIRSLY
jgi:hypothetical protein